MRRCSGKLGKNTSTGTLLNSVAIKERRLSGAYLALFGCSDTASTALAVNCPRETLVPPMCPKRITELWLVQNTSSPNGLTLQTTRLQHTQAVTAGRHTDFRVHAQSLFGWPAITLTRPSGETAFGIKRLFLLKEKRGRIYLLGASLVIGS